MSLKSASPAWIRGYAIGGLVMIFFGAFWGLMTLWGLDGSWQRALILVIVILVTILLGYSAIALLRAARRLPNKSSPEGRARGRRMGRDFGIVAGIEFGLIAIVSAWLGNSNQAEFIPPAIALLVGLHFLPLARVFNVAAYYASGAAMTLLAAVALSALLLGLPLGGPFVWSTIVGLGNAAILWVTAFYVLAAGKRLFAAPV